VKSRLFPKAGDRKNNCARKKMKSTILTETRKRKIKRRTKNKKKK